MKAAVWLLVCLSAGAFQRSAPTAQGVKAEPPRAWPIESLSVTGNQNYSPEQIFAAAGLKLGQVAGPQDFELARDRLAATGAFQTIEFRFGPATSGKGYAVAFHVVEAGPLFPVRFEDLGVPDEEIKQHLRRLDPLFGEQIPATEGLLARYARAIEELLESKGRRERVAGRLTAEAGEPLAAVFRPALTPPAIAEVRFLNNQVIPETALRRAISGVAVGVPYTEKRFRQLLETSVRPLYEARGRVRVTFPEIHAAPAEGIQGVVVTVKVNEGESYNLGAVRIEGAPLAAEELLRAAGLKSDEMFDGARVQAGVEQIERRLRREGFMRVRADLERQIRDEARRVDLLIRIQPGPRYAFGKLAIQGLDLHGEAAVRRMWTLKPGQPFNADYPDYFLNRVREEGVFENLKKARARIEPNDATLTVDVTLAFQ